MNHTKSFLTLCKMSALALSISVHAKTIKVSCEGKDVEVPDSFNATIYGILTDEAGNKASWTKCAFNQPTPASFNGFGPHRQEVTDGTKGLTGDKQVEAFVRGIFRVYCGDGKSQKVAMSENVRIVLPKLASGVPIDVAIKSTSEMKSLAETKVRDIFYSSIHRDRQAWLERGSGFNVPTFFSLPVKSTADLAKHFESVSPLDNDPRRFAISPNSHQAKDRFIMIADGSKGNIVGLAGDVLANELVETTGLYKRWYEISPKPGRPGAFDLFSTRKMFVAKDFQGGLALREFVYQDLNLLSGAYVLVIPLEKQKQLFREPIGYDDDGNLNIEQTLALQDQLWEAYLEKFISIKAAQTDDPNMLNEAASLDLNIFCSSARWKKDLLSH